MNYKVNKKEKIYFDLMVLASLFALVGLMGLFLIKPEKAFMYIGIMIGLSLLHLIGSLFMVGFLRGNAIKITPQQFPDIYDIVREQSQILGLTKIPDVYLLQNDGIINAFAMRFASRNFVVMYSSVLSRAYEEGIDVVKFIMGHELGHIKRNHVGLIRNLLLIPAGFLPFLRSAYSRACELTCDAIGASLSPQGAVKGILLLAAGTKLYKRIDAKMWLNQAKREKGVATWFSEIFATHPHLINRLEALDTVEHTDVVSISPHVNLEEGPQA